MSDGSTSSVIDNRQRLIIQIRVPARCANDEYTFVLLCCQPEGPYELPLCPVNNIQEYALDLLNAFDPYLISLPSLLDLGHGDQYRIVTATSSNLTTQRIVQNINDSCIAIPLAQYTTTLYNAAITRHQVHTVRITLLRDIDQFPEEQDPIAIVVPVLLPNQIIRFATELNTSADAHYITADNSNIVNQLLEPHVYFPFD